MCKSSKTPYNPVTSYITQYGYLQRSKPAQNQEAPEQAQAAIVVPVYQAQTVCPSPAVAKEPDSLEGTVRTKNAVKPFRRTASRVGWSMVLYIAIAMVVSYAVGLVPYYGNISTALGADGVTQALAAHEYGSAFREFCQVMFSGVDEAASTFWNYLGALAATICCSIIPMLILAKQNGFKPLSVYTKGRYFSGSLLAKGLVVSFGSLAAWAYIYSFLITLFPALNNSQFSMELPYGNTPALIFYIIYVCVCAPVFEEFIFRGVMLKSLSRYGTTFAAFATALMFSLMHGNLQQTPFTFAVGLVLAYCAIKTGSLLTGMIIHFIINTFSTTISILSEAMPLLFSFAALLVAVVYIGCIIGTLVILAKDYKRINFRGAAAENVGVLLTVEQEQPEKKWFHFLTAAGVIAVIAYTVFCIVEPIL